MQNKFKMVVFSVVCLLLFNHVCIAETPAVTSTSKFISITDIHFNPFSDCKAEEQSCSLIDKLQTTDSNNWEELFKQYSSQEVSTYQHNTNFALLQSSLLAIRAAYQQEHPRFVLVLGDLLAHEMKNNYVKYTGDSTLEGYEAFVRKNMQFISYQIKKNLPDIDAYLLVGNNDSYTGDYGIVPNGKFLQDTADIWSSLISDSHNHAAFLADFPTDGYYSIELPKTNHRIIALNTVLFSTYSSNDTNDAAKQELNWLSNQLESAQQNHEQVLLALHVPMGIDVYMTLNNKLGTMQPYWRDEWSQKFKEILDKYPNVVTGILSGHIHKDAFQLLTLNQSVEIPVTYTPSISPIYRNNPAFKVYKYDNKTFKLKDYDVYYLNLIDKQPKWSKEYDFNQRFHQDCKQCNVLDGIKKLLSRTDVSSFYETYYMAGVKLDVLTNHSIDYYQCSENQFTQYDYKDCLKKKMPYKFFFWA